MKVKVEFECEVYKGDYTPWFAIHDVFEHTNLDCVENLKVFNAETGEEL